MMADPNTRALLARWVETICRIAARWMCSAVDGFMLYLKTSHFFQFSANDQKTSLAVPKVRRSGQRLKILTATYSIAAQALFYWATARCGNLSNYQSGFFEAGLSRSLKTEKEYEVCRFGMGNGRPDPRLWGCFQRGRCQSLRAGLCCGWQAGKAAGGAVGCGKANDPSR